MFLMAYDYENTIVNSDKIRTIEGEARMEELKKKAYWLELKLYAVLDDGKKIILYQNEWEDKHDGKRLAKNGLFLWKMLAQSLCRALNNNEPDWVPDEAKADKMPELAD